MNLRRRCAATFTAVFALTLMGCGDTGAGPVVVEVSGTGFIPAAVSIAPGTEVRWVNRNVSPVSVTTAATSPGGATALPEGAEPFDSGRLREGEVFSVELNTPGTYVYWSEPNIVDGWAGTIRVEEGP